MKASELITALSQIISNEGDLLVFTQDREELPTEITQVNLEPQDRYSPHRIQLES